MEYVVVLVILIVVVPLLFAMLSRPARGAGGMAGKPHSGGVTPSEPSADQPSPAGGAVNQVAPGASERIPPG
jgi:hypothetical protein